MNGHDGHFRQAVARRALIRRRSAAAAAEADRDAVIDGAQISIAGLARARP